MEESSKSWWNFFIWKSTEAEGVGPAKSQSKTRIHKPTTACPKGDSRGIPPMFYRPFKLKLYICEIHPIYEIDDSSISILYAGFSTTFRVPKTVEADLGLDPASIFPWGYYFSSSVRVYPFFIDIFGSQVVHFTFLVRFFWLRG